MLVPLPQYWSHQEKGPLQTRQEIVSVKIISMSTDVIKKS